MRMPSAVMATDGLASRARGAFRAGRYDEARGLFSLAALGYLEAGELRRAVGAGVDAMTSAEDGIIGSLRRGDVAGARGLSLAWLELTFALDLLVPRKRGPEVISWERERRALLRALRKG